MNIHKHNLNNCINYNPLFHVLNVDNSNSTVTMQGCKKNLIWVELRLKGILYAVKVKRYKSTLLNQPQPLNQNLSNYYQQNQRDIPDRTIYELWHALLIVQVSLFLSLPGQF